MPTASDEIAIVNTSLGDLVLPNGVMVQAGECIGMSVDAWGKCLNHPVVAAWASEGRIGPVVALDAGPEAKPARKKG